jgi:hypothetical protein
MDYLSYYTQLTDQALLRLLDQSDSLDNEAQAALSAELKRRGLEGVSLQRYTQEADKRAESDIRKEGPLVKGRWVHVAVPKGVIEFPQLCPSCLRPECDVLVFISSHEQKFAGYRVLYTKWRYLQIAVPHCRRCSTRQRRLQRVGQGLAVIGLVLGLVMGIRYNLGWWMTGVLGAALVLPGIAVDTYPFRSVRLAAYDDNWMEFHFKSLEYAKEFHRLNSQTP